jgi:hypothetical protein
VRRKGHVGNLLFKADRIPSVLYGEVTTTVRPLKKGRLRVDMLCNIKATLSGRPAGVVLITDIRRKRLDELGDRDMREEGMPADRFRKEFVKRFGGPVDQIVRVIHFRGI